MREIKLKPDGTWHLTREEIDWLNGAAARETALRTQVEDLKEQLRQERMFCLCGCPASDHESYGEDGESCGDEDHECLLVAPAVRTCFDKLRAQVEELTRERDYHKSRWNPASSQLTALEQRGEQAEARLAEAATIIADLRRKLAEAGVEGSPPPGRMGTIPELKARLAAVVEALESRKPIEYRIIDALAAAHEQPCCSHEVGKMPDKPCRCRCHRPMQYWTDADFAAREQPTQEFSDECRHTIDRRRLAEGQPESAHQPTQEKPEGERG
jgi:hypothetical protein